MNRTKQEKKERLYELFLEREKENINLSQKHYSDELAFYIECLNLLAETYRHIFEVIDKPISEKHACILFNCARILRSMVVYIDLLMKGHYFDAYVIERSLFENVYLIQCFIKDERYVVKWMKNELKLSKIKEELGLYAEEILEKHYRKMSDYVHANVPAILTLIEFNSEKPSGVTIHYAPTFKVNSDTTINFLPIIGYMTLSLLYEAYSSRMKPKIKSKIEKSLNEWKVKGIEMCDKADKESEKSSDNLERRFRTK